ncbi:unnamed protein product, partial [marine sediment metagenome]
MVKYNFDKVIDRTDYHSVKWDELENTFGAKDVLPMWVADMEFRSSEPVIDAIENAVQHGIYGYTSRPSSYYQAIIDWMEKRHNWKVKKDWLAYSPGVVPALSFIIRAFTQPGDKVIIQPPVYYPFFKVIDAEGNTIRVTTEPQMKISEEEAGCILSPIQPTIVPIISQDISKVKGIVFEDHNANGVQDIGEMGLPDILVSNGLTVAVTDETGSYLLPREGHFIFITTPSDYIPTTAWYKNLLEDNLHFGLRFTPEK